MGRLVLFVILNVSSWLRAWVKLSKSIKHISYYYIEHTVVSCEDMFISKFNHNITIMFAGKEQRMWGLVEGGRGGIAKNMSIDLPEHINLIVTLRYIIVRPAFCVIAWG